MPRKKGATAVARMNCMSPDCGERAAVFQNTLGHLYTRCPACGCDQRRGAGHQAHIWRHMEPISGAELMRPPNLPAAYGEPGQPPAVTVPVGTVTTDDGNSTGDVKAVSAAVAPDPVPVGTGEGQGGGLGGLVWLALGLVGVGVATVASAAKAA